MKSIFLFPIILLGVVAPFRSSARTNTTVTIVGDDFHLNGQPTYPGRFWREQRIEGLLLNSRMVNWGISSAQTGVLPTAGGNHRLKTVKPGSTPTGRHR